MLPSLMPGSPASPGTAVAGHGLSGAGVPRAAAPHSPSADRPCSFLPGVDPRYMSSYTSSYASDWSAPDTMKRYSMYLTPKGKAPLLPGRTRRLPGWARVLPVCLGPSQHVPPVRTTYDLAPCSSGASLLRTQGSPPSLTSSPHPSARSSSRFLAAGLPSPCQASLCGILPGCLQFASSRSSGHRDRVALPPSVGPALPRP